MTYLIVLGVVAVGCVLFSTPIKNAVVTLYNKLIKRWG